MLYDVWPYTYSLLHVAATWDLTHCSATQVDSYPHVALSTIQVLDINLKTNSFLAEAFLKVELCEIDWTWQRKFDKDSDGKLLFIWLLLIPACLLESYD